MVAVRLKGGGGPPVMGFEERYEKWTPSSSSSWAPLATLGGHLGPKGIRKGCQKDTQRGSETEQNPGPQKN